MPTLSQLITRTRRRVDDKGTVKPFFDDAWMTDAFNEAQQEACIRARLLIDDETAECCVVTLDESAVEYELDARVLDVEHCRIPGRTRPMGRADYDMIAFEAERRLEKGQVGEPLEYALRDNNVGGAGKRLVLDRPPNTDLFTELHLVVRRLPLADMVVPNLGHSPPIDPTPEINPQLHRSLIHWVAHVAYDSQDADKGDASKAEKALARFEAAFGVRLDANVERKRLRHRPSIVVPDSTFRGHGPGRYPRYRPWLGPQND